MQKKDLNILLAEDDPDDCIFFEQALKGIDGTYRLTSVDDGEQLMRLLNDPSVILSDVLFLNLSMPRKSGFECISEIKRSNRLEFLPIVIFSTSYEEQIVNDLYISGVSLLIRKPSEFSQLKKVIDKSLTLICNNDYLRPSLENFVLTTD